MAGNSDGAFCDGRGAALCSLSLGLSLLCSLPLNILLNLRDCLTVGVGWLPVNQSGAEPAVRFLKPAA
jgi:hypothetical protein